jgi:hypothetical protein
VIVRVPAPGPGQWQAKRYLGAQIVHTGATTAGQPLEWRLPPGRLAAIVFHPAN